MERARGRLEWHHLSSSSSLYQEPTFPALYMLWYFCGAYNWYKAEQLSIWMAFKNWRITFTNHFPEQCNEDMKAMLTCALEKVLWDSRNSHLPPLESPIRPKQCWRTQNITRVWLNKYFPQSWEAREKPRERMKCRGLKKQRTQENKLLFNEAQRGPIKSQFCWIHMDKLILFLVTLLMYPSVGTVRPDHQLNTNPCFRPFFKIPIRRLWWSE